MKDKKERHRALFPILGTTDSWGLIIHSCGGVQFGSFKILITHWMLNSTCELYSIDVSDTHLLNCEIMMSPDIVRCHLAYKVNPGENHLLRVY